MSSYFVVYNSKRLKNGCCKWRRLTLRHAWYLVKRLLCTVGMFVKHCRYWEGGAYLTHRQSYGRAHSTLHHLSYTVRCLLSQQTCGATCNEHFFCSWEQLYCIKLYRGNLCTEINHTESVVCPVFQSNKGQECLRVEEVFPSTYTNLWDIGNVRPSSLPDVWVRFSVELRAILTRCVRTVIANASYSIGSITLQVWHSRLSSCTGLFISPWNVLKIRNK
jgi:hypothetical protein